MQTNAPDRGRSSDERLAELILRAFPMPQADPKRKMPLIGLYMTDPSHPVVRQLYDEFKQEEGIPPSCAMSDKERLMCDLSMMHQKVKIRMYELCQERLAQTTE